jgi:hypothetical protein
MVPRRRRWAVHVACMVEKRKVYRVFENTEGKNHFKDMSVDEGMEWINL